MYLEDFRERLDRILSVSSEQDETPSKRKLLVYTSETFIPNQEQLLMPNAANSMLRKANEGNPKSRRWLYCMDAFADAIQNIRAPFTENPILENDIKVALIDDGVDAFSKSLRGKIRGGESFGRGHPDADGPSPYYTSSEGHGTVMADMICRVCPMARLYVYKLGMPSASHDQFSMESACLVCLKIPSLPPVDHLCVITAIIMIQLP
jgi:hypothetical protein